jgi:SAM-dependent methyltransferase
MNLPPRYHIGHHHILDPHDRRGLKSRYITLLHEQALQRYLPYAHADGVAVDLGCGFGRLTPLLGNKGWRAIGIDPVETLLDYARQHYPGPSYLAGGLPDLPLEEASVDLLMVLNILRPFLHMGCLDAFRGVGRYLRAGATVFLIDNLKHNDPDYLSEAQITALMAAEGCRLRQRITLRAGRWWMIYLIRYGLIPPSLFSRIADWELARMARKSGAPRLEYWNVLFIFDKV